LLLKTEIELGVQRKIPEIVASGSPIEQDEHSRSTKIGAIPDSTVILPLMKNDRLSD